MKILITGHPRTGTGYAAKCLQDIGLDVGHEKLGADGISSWLWAVDCYDNARWGDNYRDIFPEMTIMLVRNPHDVIASMAHTAARAFAWMGQYVEIPAGTDIVKAAAVLVAWTEKCLENRKPDFLVRTVDFAEFCERTFSRRPSDALEGFNSRHHPNLTAAEKISVESHVQKYRALTANYWRG